MQSVTEIVVRYAETDRMGIAHHANYLVWFEQARTEYTRKLSCSYSELEKRGLLSPLLSVEVHYLRTCTYEDRLQVICRLVKLSQAQMTFAYTVLEEVTPRPTRLDRVTLSGPDAPAAGAVPGTGVAVAETGAELSSVSWSGALESGKFGYNQTYTVNITLSAKPGYAFGDAVAATLNGETVQATKISDDTLQITRSYPALLPPEISVTPAVLTLEIGQSATLSVTDPTGAALRWTSGDSSVAAVDQSGRVTGVAAGNTEITVTNAYGKLAAVPVTVKSATDGETNPQRPEDGSGSGSAPQQNPEAPGMNQNAGQAQKPGQIVSTGDGNEILEYVTIFLFCMAALAVLVVLTIALGLRLDGGVKGTAL